MNRNTVTDKELFDLKYHARKLREALAFMQSEKGLFDNHKEYTDLYNDVFNVQEAVELAASAINNKGAKV